LQGRAREALVLAYRSVIHLTHQAAGTNGD
jgi:hypothetical protein